VFRRRLGQKIKLLLSAFANTNGSALSPKASSYFIQQLLIES